MTDPSAAMSMGREEQPGASAKPGSQGRVTWQHRWSTKSLSKYTATVSPGKGLVFVTCEDYATACAFAERLASFLRFPLESRVPEANRKQGGNARRHR